MIPESFISHDNSMIRFLLPTCLLVLPVHGATSFLGTNSTDFNDSTNWDNGLPSDGNDATVTSPAILTGDFNATTGIDYDLTINSDLETGAYELQHRSGSNGRDVSVGVGSGAVGSLTVNDGGTLDIAGIGSDLFIGGSGGTGAVVVENGGTFAASKTIDISGGSSLSFESGALMSGSVSDELQLRNGSTLAFEIAGNGSHFTLVGNGVQVRLGSTPNLSVSFLSAPTVGMSYNLITNVSGFTNYNGVGSGYTFAPSNITVSGLGVGQEANIVYGSSLTLVVVPEPEIALLGSMGLLCLLKRRR